MAELVRWSAPVFLLILKLHYLRLLRAGKPEMVALIALARKLLTILNAILRDGKQWQNA
jgi:transposase